MEALSRPILTLPDLDAAWRDLAGPWGFSVGRVWGLLMDADGHVAQVVDITDESPDERPDDLLVGNLMAILEDLLTDELVGGSVALMRARPGGPPARTVDDVWCRALHRALAAAPFRSWPVYRADDATVEIAPPDALIADVGA